MKKLHEVCFTYTEVGLLDKTHIHLFTFHEIVRMFETAGFEVEDVRTVVPPINLNQRVLINQLLSIENSAKRFWYETYQYAVLARMI